MPGRSGPDFLRGVAQVLALEARQAVDLEREDERAEAEGAGQAEAGPAGAANPEAGGENDDQRHEDRDQVAPVEVVGAEGGRAAIGSADGGAAHRGGQAGAAALAPARRARAAAPARRAPAPPEPPSGIGPGWRTPCSLPLSSPTSFAAGPFQALGEGLLGDPAGVGVAGLRSAIGSSSAVCGERPRRPRRRRGAVPRRGEQQQRCLWARPRSRRSSGWRSPAPRRPPTRRGRAARSLRRARAKKRKERAVSRKTRE